HHVCRPPSFFPMPAPLDRFLSFFHAPLPTVIDTLSLHDALPISRDVGGGGELGHLRRELSPARRSRGRDRGPVHDHDSGGQVKRSEEHTSELQSPDHLVCRLLLEKKKTYNVTKRTTKARK